MKRSQSTPTPLGNSNSAKKSSASAAAKERKEQAPVQRRALTAIQRELILDHRLRALKLARHILKHWGVRLHEDEITSATDMALCDAGGRYNPESGVEFVTYLFYFIKGALARTITENRSINQQLCCETRDDGKSGDDALTRVIDQHAARNFDTEQSESSPARELMVREFRKYCSSALAALSKLEREIVVRVHVHDYKVAAVARQLGYSRGHVSTLRRQAFDKMRPALDFYSEAA